MVLFGVGFFVVVALANSCMSSISSSQLDIHTSPCMIYHSPSYTFTQTPIIYLTTSHVDNLSSPPPPLPPPPIMPDNPRNSTSQSPLPLIPHPTSTSTSPHSSTPSSCIGAAYYPPSLSLCSIFSAAHAYHYQCHAHMHANGNVTCQTAKPRCQR